MDVVGDSRAGDVAEVPAQVEATRPVDAERLDRGDGETVDLEHLVARQIR